MGMVGATSPPQVRPRTCERSFQYLRPTHRSNATPGFRIVGLTLLVMPGCCMRTDPLRLSDNYTVHFDRRQNGIFISDNATLVQGEDDDLCSKTHMTIRYSCCMHACTWSCCSSGNACRATTCLLVVSHTKPVVLQIIQWPVVSQIQWLVVSQIQWLVVSQLQQPVVSRIWPVVSPIQWTS